MTAYKNWTSEELKLVCKLASDGLTARVIGMRVNRSRNSIIGILHRHKNGRLGRSLKWSDQEIETLIKMRADGVPYKIISEKLDRTMDACTTKMRQMGLSHGPKKGVTTERDFVEKWTPKKHSPPPNSAVVRESKAIRRGYKIPIEKENDLTELLKQGIPCTEAYQKVGGVPV